MQLKEDEVQWINSHPERCEACGHLDIFHNDHCCPFCLVEDCPCEYGLMPEKGKPEDVLRSDRARAKGE